MLHILELYISNGTLVAGVDYPSRETMSKTYELLQDDLESALSLFGPDQALNYGPDYSYFNEMTTKALYARIALQMNDWTKALEYSDFIIENSGILLMDNMSYAQEWEKPEDPVSEIILEFSAPRTSDDGTVSSSVASEYYGFETLTNYNELVASGDLLDLYDTIDIRAGLFRVELLPTSINENITERPYYFTKKFQDDPGTTCIRISEMFLIRSEALCPSWLKPRQCLTGFKFSESQGRNTIINRNGKSSGRNFSRKKKGTGI